MRETVHWLAGLCLLGAAAGVQAQSMQFFGSGSADADRVKVQIGDLDTNAASMLHRPADVGAGDFTIELWLRPATGNNGAVACGSNYNWINGNVIYDRDRFNQGRAFGISLGGGAIAFGVKNAGDEVRTICGSEDLRDGSWHHVAVQRRRSDGHLWLYVDGALDVESDGPDGDLSYPDDGVPGSFCGGACVNSDPYIVLGAEKHDVGAAFPSYSGHLTELRISASLRYSSDFTRPTAPFTTDGSTAALYHFNEGGGSSVADTSSASGGPSNGTVRFNQTATRPVWSDATPFGGSSPQQGTLSFSSASASVAETGASVTLRVGRAGGSDGAVTVSYATANGTALGGSDFTAASGSLRWEAGDTAEKTVVIAVLDDGLVEGNESFEVRLSQPGGGAALAAPSAVNIIINDNDNSTPGPAPPAPTPPGGGGGGGGGALDLLTLCIAARLCFSMRRRRRATVL